ncbi:hypothetical protein Tco_0956190 [Tanacetum coccineum]|uniref:Uncharacterized protein n=1 Tax=Tanacetum coccineum TaxID=301880 RepID=A0ABQ5E9A6_9ASTR
MVSEPEDSVGNLLGTSASCLFTIPTTIPDTTPMITPPATQIDTPSGLSEDPSSDHIPPLQLSPNVLSSDVTPRLHSADHSSSDSSSEASSYFHLDASFDSSSRHSSSDHSSPDLPSTSTGLSRKRCRSPVTYVPALSPISGALSPVRADLIPSPKRVKDSGVLVDKPHLEQDSDPEIQAEIDECFAYAYALRDRGIDARVVVEAVDQDEIETGVRGPVKVKVERVTHPVMPEDIPKPAQDGTSGFRYKTLGDCGSEVHVTPQAYTSYIVYSAMKEFKKRAGRDT